MYACCKSWKTAETTSSAISLMVYDDSNSVRTHWASYFYAEPRRPCSYAKGTLISFVPPAPKLTTIPLDLLCRLILSVHLSRCGKTLGSYPASTYFHNSSIQNYHLDPRRHCNNMVDCILLCGCLHLLSCENDVASECRRNLQKTENFKRNLACNVDIDRFCHTD